MRGPAPEPEDDDALLAELGVDTAAPDDLTVLKHVKPRAEIQAAEEIANRTPCEDFDAIQAAFRSSSKRLGQRRPAHAAIRARMAEIKQGDFFIRRRPKGLCR